MERLSVPLAEATCETTSETLLRWRQGDENALDDLCRRYMEPLQRFLHLRRPRGALGLLDTGDLVQETLTSTFQNLDRFRPQGAGALGAYLYQVARNLIGQELRGIDRRPPCDGLEQEPVDSRPSPLEEAIGKQELDLYERALRALSDLERELIVHRLEMGFTFREVAEIFGKTSEDSARMAVSRAVKKLTQHIHRLAQAERLEL